ncbi:MAG TPA: abortive phage infection protein [Hyphomonadaceae bacterium]|nr:abortive phage infection protein [Hyphomonadaceae bacterium UKL13-1]HCP63703.1 abortive phage infection protein [Hyphomonadaceae bacterium]
MKPISMMDWDIIEARVSKACERHQFRRKTLGFLAIVIDQIFPGHDDQLQEIMTDGPDDRGVDAIHIVEGPSSAEVFIFQSKYRESLANCHKTINDAEVLKVSLFLTELFDKADTLASSGNFRLHEAVGRIWELHDKGKICRYRVIFCSNGVGFSTTAQGIIDSVKASHSSVFFECYTGHDVVQAMAIEGRDSEDGQLQVISKEILERSDGDIRGAIASVDAQSFVDLITADDGETIKRHLFDDNLRVFLGAKGGYNQSIISTATSGDSYLFWYLNNGVTITCKSFSYNKGHTNPKLVFKEFQIVNGAQTSHSLVEAARTNPEALANVVVMVRMYATDRADIAERVAVATNSQARIQSRDLMSNHDALKKLELAFKERGYFFERKKNMHSDKPEKKRIDALKLGQIILSYELREPDKAKTESDSIFDFRFHQIFNISRSIDELIRLYQLYEVIEEKRDAYQANFASSLESDHEHQYLIYGHWYVLFACKLLHVKSQKAQLPVEEEARSLVEEAIRRVAVACNQQKAVAHYQMFRSSRTKERILGEISDKQIDFFELLVNS